MTKNFTKKINPRHETILIILQIEILIDHIKVSYDRYLMVMIY